jgi:hypothetical protein
MNSVKNQISRRDGLKLGLAGLTVSPWGAPFYARAATEEKMTIAKVEVDADMIFREGHLIEYSTYLAFLLSPFLTPASGKIHMATTMKTAVIMMYVEKSGRIGDPLQ